MNWALFFALLSICSRGGFEIVMPKPVAYLASLLGFYVGVLWFYLGNRMVFRARLPVLFLSLVFIFTSFISLFITFIDTTDLIYAVYIVYPIVITFSFFVFYSVRCEGMVLREIERSITVLILVLFSLATLQEFKLIDLPGATPAYGIPGNLVRPSSITGSYLHYPLIMVMLGVFLQVLKQRLSLVTLVAFASVFLAFSRSGMMLVLSHVALLMAHVLFTGRLRLSHKRLIYALLMLVAATVVLIMTGLVDILWARATSALDTQGIGNDDRIAAWTYGINVISDSNLLFGSNFGKATNLTANLTGAESYVVESGILQNMINFGFVGSLVFFGLFAYMYQVSSERYFRFFLIAMLLQSLVYQSTEVLPFILGVMFLRSLAISPSAVAWRRP